MRRQEMKYSWAKSSCHANILHCAPILRDIVKDAVGNLFPSLAEQNALLEITPEYLRELGVFLFVDGTTAPSVNTANPQSAATDYNGYNGFGLNIQIATDILGRCRYYYIGFPGAMHDSTLYRATDLYLQENGIAWDNDKTVGTDRAYRGPCNTNAGAAHIVHPLSIAEIAALPVHLQADARAMSAYLSTKRFGNENFINVFKRGAFSSNRSNSRIRLNPHRDHQIVLLEVALLVEIMLQQMRGQVCQSNPAVIGAGVEGIRQGRRYINHFTEGALYSETGRERAYYGDRITGAGTIIPPPLHPFGLDNHP